MSVWLVAVLAAWPFLCYMGFSWAAGRLERWRRDRAERCEQRERREMWRLLGRLARQEDDRDYIRLRARARIRLAEADAVQADRTYRLVEHAYAMSDCGEWN